MKRNYLMRSVSRMEHEQITKALAFLRHHADLGVASHRGQARHAGLKAITHCWCDPMQTCAHPRGAPAR